ncbi:hypothetical protein PROH_05195 [Prochlorothrix hollandica PCC 9006 = CALU 1027]|uniref:Uncharacterized protein n=1 Tax=Prochlorothrix hollandica PCC 9006 = CALU 1027 TaxID=317619 RepID=A0A0M2Q145_PROHO|nr:hypothetical protein PROH_05195 [Prochlorothrix hollandica PCC 9006 = CALU 1027]
MLGYRVILQRKENTIGVIDVPDQPPRDLRLYRDLLGLGCWLGGDFRPGLGALGLVSWELSILGTQYPGNSVSWELSILETQYPGNDGS